MEIETVEELKEWLSKLPSACWRLEKPMVAQRVSNQIRITPKTEEKKDSE